MHIEKIKTQKRALVIRHNPATDYSFTVSGTCSFEESVYLGSIVHEAFKGVKTNATV